MKKKMFLKSKKKLNSQSCEEPHEKEAETLPKDLEIKKLGEKLLFDA